MEYGIKIRRALKLYPFYEAASGDYLFFSVIQTIFLTLVKELSAEQIIEAILIADILDMVLEYPSYRLIQRSGNSRSILIGGLLPVFGILIVTLSQNLVLIAFGISCNGIAANFQSIAGVAARNNLMLLGEKNDFTKLVSRGSMIYSGISMVASIIAPFLFSMHRYAPSMLCLVICSAAAVIAFLMPDYTEREWARSLVAGQKEQRRRKTQVEQQVIIGRGFRLLVIVFCMFFCAGTVFRNNAEIILSDYLRALVTEQETIYIYGVIIWGARIAQFSSNAMMQKMLGCLRENIVLISSLVLLIAFLSVAFAGLFLGKTMVSVILIGILYMVVRGVFWDPLRTFLRTTAADTNNKKRQQKMMMLLNIGQSGIAILMDLLVIGILHLYALEYVFLVFAGVLTVETILAAWLGRELRQQTELAFYCDILNRSALDRISEHIFNCLLNAGYERREALSYKILLEEKLLECMNSDAENIPVEVKAIAKMDDIHIDLVVGGKHIDIFKMTESGDIFSKIIYNNILRNL